jgi:hypothetical protein
MFRHQMCHPQGRLFVTLPNYISTIAALVKINKVFKNLKIVRDKLVIIIWSLYGGRIYDPCFDVAVVPGRHKNVTAPRTLNAYLRWVGGGWGGGGN